MKKNKIVRSRPDLKKAHGLLILKREKKTIWKAGSFLRKFQCCDSKHKRFFYPELVPKFCVVEPFYSDFSFVPAPVAKQREAQGNVIYLAMSLTS